MLGGQSSIRERTKSCVYNGTTYAADGLRRSRTVGGVTTNYVLDGQSVVRERRNGTNYATYLTGPRGPEYRRDDATGQIRWYLYDGLGSVVGEVDPHGNVTYANNLDVYGAVRTDSGTSTSNHKFVGGLGHASENETGLIYMRARYMDPTTGRFVCEDPAENGLNWYAYCGSDPVNKNDPTGQFELTGEMITMGIISSFVGFIQNFYITFLKTGDLTAALISGLIGGVAGFFAPMGPVGAIGSAFATTFGQNLCSGMGLWSSLKRALVSAGIAGATLGLALNYGEIRNAELTYFLIGMDAELAVDVYTVMT